MKAKQIEEIEKLQNQLKELKFNLNDDKENINEFENTKKKKKQKFLSMNWIINRTNFRICC